MTPGNIQTIQNLPCVPPARSVSTKTLRRRHLAYRAVPASLTTKKRLSAAGSVGETPTPIKRNAPPHVICALPGGLPATAARRARRVRPVRLNKKTSVKNAIQVNFQTRQDSPNATSAIQGNTVKQDKHRAFLVFLVKRVLLLDKNAIYAPRAISPIQRHKKCAVNVLKDPATKALATLVVSRHPRARSSTPPMKPRTAPKVFTARVGRLDESRATKESTPPTPGRSNVFPVRLVHLLHPSKPLNVKSAPRAGFKKTRAKTNAINRKMAPFRRVVLLRW